MPKTVCKVLLIENNNANRTIIAQLLKQAKASSLAEGYCFELVCSDGFEQGIRQFNNETFDVILLALNLLNPDGIDSLVELKAKVPQVPIIVQIDNEDETLIVKAFQMGADGYIQRQNLDIHLLLYALRSAIERKQYLGKLESLQQKKQQEQELYYLEQLGNVNQTSVTARMFGAEALKESLPDIFAELVQNYGEVLDMSLEQRAYRVEYNLSEQLKAIADKLGFLKAGPRDVIDVHTRALKQKNQNVTLAKAQAYVEEGRLMVLELMGYLTSYYRKYYIGLSNLSISPKLTKKIN